MADRAVINCRLLMKTYAYCQRKDPLIIDTLKLLNKRLKVALLHYFNKIRWYLLW